MHLCRVYFKHIEERIRRAPRQVTFNSLTLPRMVSLAPTSSVATSLVPMTGYVSQQVGDFRHFETPAPFKIHSQLFLKTVDVAWDVVTILPRLKQFRK